MTGTKFNAFTLSGVTLLLALTLAPAVAQETEFNIEAQPLAKALLEFNEQSGLTVAARRDLVADKTAPAVHGEMEPEVALGRILSGTGLKLTQLSSGGYTITADAADLGKYRSGRSPVPMARNQIVAAQSQTAASRSEATRSGRSDERGAGIVTGKVTDARTGANLKGAKVTIEETGQWTSTNDLGEFRFVNVPTGSVTLTVSFLGYAGQSTVIGVRSDGASQDFALRGGSEMEEIVVFGQRSARAIALNQERTADNFSTVLSGDFLGQFDGTTVSEALRRAPGVAFEQDPESGDGTNIIVRGLSADFNTVTINGLRVPESTGQGRGPDLSNLLADSVAKITLNKTLLASQDSMGTGALVDIETKRPLDRPLRFASFGFEAGRTADDFVDDALLTGTISGVFGVNQNFGASASVQYRERDIVRLSYNTNYRFGKYLPAISGQPIPGIGGLDPREFQFPYEPGVTGGYLAEVQNNYGNVSTNNLSATISVDWRVASNTLLNFDYSRFEKQTDSLTRSVFARPPLVDRLILPIDELGGEERAALIWEDIAIPSGVPGLLFEVRHDMADIRDQQNNTDTFNFRGETRANRLTLSWSAGFADGETKSPFEAFLQLTQPFLSVITALDESFLDASARSSENTIAGLIISPWAERSGVNEYPLPLFSEAGFAYFNDADNFFVSNGAVNFVEGENTRTTGSLDIKYDFPDSPIQHVEAGIFYESADFRSDLFPTVELLTANDPTLGDLGLTLSEENLAPIGVNSGFNVVRERAITGFFSNLESIAAETANLTLNLRNQNGNNPLFAGRKTAEDELAAYVQARVNIGKLQLFPGVRVSQTKIDARTPQFPTITDENGVFDTAFRDANTELIDVSATQNEVLPRVLFNYRFTDNFILRGGYFKTIARPQISLMNSNNQLRLDLQPVFGPNSNQPRIAITVGNPDLQPAKTDNWDLSVEYYGQSLGVAKLSLFYKETDNLIENNQTAEVSGLSGLVLPDDPRFQNLPDNLFVTRLQPVNSPDSSRLWGIEVSLEKQFTSLPSPFDGLGAWVNYTYSESSKVELRNWFFGGELIPLRFRTRYQGQPDDSGTIALTYNKNSWDASISYTRQDVRQFATDVYGVNRFFDQDETLDIRAQYQFEIGDTLLTAYVEGADLLKGSDDPDVERYLGGERELPRYYSSASYFGGRIFRLGISATF